MNKKYLTYQITTTKAGLKHQSYNLKTLIAEAASLGRIPVVSSLILYGKHNNGNELRSDFNEYYDLNSISLKGERQEVIRRKDFDQTPTEFHMGEPIPDDCVFAQRNFPENEGCSWKFVKHQYDGYFDVELPYTKDITSIAEQIIKKLSPEYASVHVRRGDVVKSLFYKYPRLLWDTKPANILKKLTSNKSPENVYIMSNEEKKNFFSFKNSSYKFFFAKDFEGLEELRKTDNYKLFCIESLIFKNGSLRIGTFKDDNPLYHDSLSVTTF